MATADLGIRISLQDTASGGFASLGASLVGLSGVITRISSLWSSMSIQQQAVATGIAAAGITYHAFSDTLGDVVDAAGDLQASMIQVSINVADTDGRMDDMRNTLINLADYSIFSAETVANGFVLLGQKGFTAADIIDNNLGASMVNLSEAINSDTVPAANLLSSAMQTWHADAKEGAYYASALSFAFHNGVPDVSALQQAIMQAGAQAVDAKIPFKEFVLMLDELGKQGLSGSQAATALRYMIASLLSPTNKAATEMANLGVITVQQTTPALEGLLNQTNKLVNNPLRLTGTITDLQKLYTEAKKVGTLHTDQSFMEWGVGIGAIKNNLYDAKGNFQGLSAVIDILGPKLASLNTSEDFNTAIENLFNVRGGKGASALLNDLGFTSEQIKKMSAAYDQYIKQDGARQAADKTTSGMNATNKELAATLRDLGAQLGQTFLGPLTAVKKHLNDFLNDIRQHHPTLLMFGAAFLVIGTVLSGIALVIGIAVAAFALFGGPLIVIGLAIGAIIGFAATLAGVFVVVKDHWSQITGVAQGFWHIIQQVGGFLGSIFGPIFKELGDQLKHFGGQELSSVGNMIQTWLVPSLHQLGDAFQSIAPALGVIGKLLLIVSGVIAGFFGAQVLGIAIGLVFGLAHAFMIAFASIVGIVTGAITIVTGIIHILVGIFQMTIGAIITLFTQGPDKAGQMFMKGLGSLGHGVQAILGGLVQTIGSLLMGLVGAPLGFIMGFVSGIIKFFQHLFDVLLGHSIIPDIVNGIVHFLKLLIDIGTAPIKLFINLAVGLFHLFQAGVQLEINGVITIFNVFKSVAQAVTSGIGNFFSGLGTTISNIASNIKKTIGDIVNNMKNIPGVGGIISGGQSLLSHIPGFANGGIVTSPTLALIGEGREPEVVLPVSKLAAFMGNYKGAGSTAGGGTIVVPLVVDGQQVAGVVVDRITGQVRQLGGSRMFR